MAPVDRVRSKTDFAAPIGPTFLSQFFLSHFLSYRRLVYGAEEFFRVFRVFRGSIRDD